MSLDMRRGYAPTFLRSKGDQALASKQEKKKERRKLINKERKEKMEERRKKKKRKNGKRKNKQKETQNEREERTQVCAKGLCARQTRPTGFEPTLALKIGYAPVMRRVQKSGETNQTRWPGFDFKRKKERQKERKKEEERNSERNT